MGRKRKLPENTQVEVLSTRVVPGFYSQVLAVARERDLTIAQLVRRSLRDFVLRASRHESRTS